MTNQEAQHQAKSADCAIMCRCGGAYGLYDGKYKQTISPWGVGCTRCGGLHKNSLICWRMMRNMLTGDSLMKYGLHLLIWRKKNKK